MTTYLDIATGRRTATDPRIDPKRRAARKDIRRAIGADAPAPQARPVIADPEIRTTVAATVIVPMEGPTRVIAEQDGDRFLGIGAAEPGPNDTVTCLKWHNVGLNRRNAIVRRLLDHMSRCDESLAMRRRLRLGLAA